MSYLVYIMILMIAMTGYAVQQVGPQADFSAIQNLTWNSSLVDIQTPTQPELGNLITTFINAGGEIMYGVVRWSVDVAVDNPYTSWKLIIYLILASIIAPIAVALFKLIVIIVILIKEFIQSRREKRLSKLKADFKKIEGGQE